MEESKAILQNRPGVSTKEPAELQMILSCLQTLAESNQRQQRRQRLQFAFSVILICAVVALTLAVICMGGELIHTVNETAEKAGILIEETGETIQTVNNLAGELESLDYERLAASVTTLAEEGTKSIDEALLSLKTTMEQTQSAVDKLNRLDVDGLNEGIQELNAILRPMTNFFGNFGK